MDRLQDQMPLDANGLARVAGETTAFQALRKAEQGEVRVGGCGGWVSGRLRRVLGGEAAAASGRPWAGGGAIRLFGEVRQTRMRGGR